MAIINLTSYTGRLYQYDDAAQQFIMNPDNDSGLNALTGWNNTSYTVAQLSAQHNGTTIFTGRPDYSGDAQKFPIMILASGGVITNTTQVKVRVDRDPVLTLATLTEPITLSKEDMTDNGDGTHYIDIEYDIDKGYVYEQLAQTERWYFPSDGPFDTIYPQSISFTDADTGRSVSSEFNIDYQEFANINPTTLSNVMYTYGAPKESESSVITTRIADGKTFVESVTDVRGSANDWEELDTAQQPILVQNGFGGNGISRDGANNVRFNRSMSYLTDPEQNTDKYTIVVEFTPEEPVVPTSFQYELMEIKNVLQLIMVPVGNQYSYRLLWNGGSFINPAGVFDYGTLKTAMFFIDVSGNTIDFEDDQGITASGPFTVGTNQADPYSVYNRFDTNRDFRGEIHRYYMINGLYNTTQNKADVVNQTAIDYGVGGGSGGSSNTQTIDGYSVETNDGYEVDTII